MFRFGQASRDNLVGVHPDLVLTVSRALLYSEVDFKITEGIRDYHRQKQLVAEGKSRTMRSQHLYGKAIDVMAVGVSDAWDMAHYAKIADAMKKAADEIGVDIQWGGDWVSFKDGPHFELARA